MVVGGQRYAPAALSPRKRPGTHCTGCWVGPSAAIDGCGKSRSPPGLDPRYPDTSILDSGIKGGGGVGEIS
jgi:hypothetical protein